MGCAGILYQSMGARNLVGIGLSLRLARLHRLAESIPGSLKMEKYRLCYRFDPCRTEMDSIFPGSELYFTLQSIGQGTLMAFSSGIEMRTKFCPFTGCSE